jgi:uncharacterized protein (TIGR00725 family)
MRRRVIAVVGTSREANSSILIASELGSMIAENGWVLITGGRDSGVMKAANEGAKEVEGSLTIGILPNAETDVLPAVDVAIITDTGEARNNIIVLSADIVIACGVEDPGTASEVGLALKAGKPVVVLGASDAAREFFVGIGAGLIHIAESPTIAIAISKQLMDGLRILK